MKKCFVVVGLIWLIYVHTLSVDHNTIISIYVTSFGYCRIVRIHILLIRAGSAIESEDMIIVYVKKCKQFKGLEVYSVSFNNCPCLADDIA